MKEIKMQERNETVTLTFSQFWEIEQLLKREIRELEPLCEATESVGYEEGERVFKRRLDLVKDALDAVSKWGRCF